MNPLRGVVLSVAILLTSAGAHAVDYPQRPVHLIVPSAPGGAPDILARIFGSFLSERLGQPVVVENRPGAGAALGAKHVSSSRPDGHTLLITTPLTSLPVAMKDPGLVVSRDLEFISRVATSPNAVAVKGSGPYKSYADLATVSKSDADKLNYASYAVSIMLTTELVNRAAGIKAANVPFTNIPDALKAVMAGDVDYVLTGYGIARGFVARGELRFLSLTSRSRDPNAPNVPSAEEAGLDIDITSWIGLMAPAGTPREVIQRLNAEARAFVADEASAAKLRNMGFTPYADSPEQFRSEFMKEESMMTETGKRLKITPQ